MDFPELTPEFIKELSDKWQEVERGGMWKYRRWQLDRLGELNEYRGHWARNLADAESNLVHYYEMMDVHHALRFHEVPEGRDLMASARNSAVDAIWGFNLYTRMVSHEEDRMAEAAGVVPVQPRGKT